MTGRKAASAAVSVAGWAGQSHCGAASVQCGALHTPHSTLHTPPPHLVRAHITTGGKGVQTGAADWVNCAHC